MVLPREQSWKGGFTQRAELKGGFTQKAELEGWFYPEGRAGRVVLPRGQS